MKIKNPVMFTIFVIFALLNIVDTITAFFILPGEANPVYLWTGSLWFVLFIKFGIVFGAGFFVFRNIYPSTLTYYMLVLMLVLGSLVVGYGAYSNTVGIRNPDLIEKASEMPKEEKVEAYSWMIIILYVIPGLIALVPFLVYNYSLKYANIDKTYFKDKKKWWR